MDTHDTLRQVRSVCRLCAATCGILVDVRGENVLAVHGDPIDETSRGYTCTKGRGIPEFHHRQDRLNAPSVAGLHASWDECLDGLAEVLTGIIDTHGVDAVARYTGTSVMSDFAAGWANVAFFDALGSKQCYSSATVDIAPVWKAAELVTGFAREAAPVWDPEDSPDVCILIGHNPVVSHGYWGLFLADPIRRIRDFTARGGELWVIDPRRTETAALATVHLATKPDTDAPLLAWLVRELLRSGCDERELRNHVDPGDLIRLRRAVDPFELGMVAERTGIAEPVLVQLLQSVRDSGRIACISGTGVSFGRHALVTEWLRWVLLIVTGSLDVAGGMRFRTGFLAPVNQRSKLQPAPPDGRVEPGPASSPHLARWLGEYPSVALVPEIEAGRIRALLVLGGNPLVAFPDPERTRNALEQLEVLVVVDVCDTAMTAMATHVLPVADVLEHADLAVRENGVYIPAVTRPLHDRRPQWWALAQLAKRLGLDLLGGLDPDLATDEEVLRFIGGRAGADVVAMEQQPLVGVGHPAETGWVRTRMLPNGRWRIAPQQLVERLPDIVADADDDAAGSLMLVSRRVAVSLNSAMYGRGRDAGGTPTVHVSQRDADVHGMEDGGMARVVSANGELTALVEISESVPDGVVSVTHGRLSANVGCLVSASGDIDPLTGHPRMTSIPVRLLAVPG